METKVLVAYATSYGSTQEIAEVISETLRSQGLAVDLQLIRNVRILEGYRAVVLGAPLYMFHWHKDALHFLSQYQKILAGHLPLAIFAGGPFGKGNGNEWQEVRARLDLELAKFPWLTPISVEIVGGKFDPTKLRFPYNLIPVLKKMPASDLRDWEAIRAWASSLAAKFLPDLPQ
ncbi:MAG: flavodoxin domain-containing protein [Atribacterota bacterium]|nr:flavodoxin domain-containing protein [Atribacterota bacterium]